MAPGLSREEVACRVAQAIPDGSYVNLGVGMPSLVSSYVPEGREIVYHSENGILGLGPPPEPGSEDPELVNASKQPATLMPGGAYVHHTDSFMLIRGGHLDVAVLGAFQVGANGDLANWTTDDDGFPPAVGGAMDLAVGAKRLFVMMAHTASDGRPKLLERCTFPLTARGVVERIFTDLAVIEVTPDGLVVSELAEGVSRQHLQELTDARLLFSRELKRLGGILSSG